MTHVAEYTIELRASPMQEVNCGSQDNHISKRSKFLPHAFHNFPNP